MSVRGVISGPKAVTAFPDSHAHMICNDKELKKMETTIKVNGMKCVHCAARVKKAAEAVANVSAAEVDLEGGKAVLTHENADMKAVVDAINALGFEASLTD